MTLPTLSEKTLVPLGFVLIVIGGVSHVNSIDAKATRTESRVEVIEELSQKRRTDWEKLYERLGRIEGILERIDKRHGR